MRPLSEFHENVLGRASDILTVPQRVPLLRAGAPLSFPCRSRSWFPRLQPLWQLFPQSRSVKPLCHRIRLQEGVGRFLLFLSPRRLPRGQSLLPAARLHGRHRPLPAPSLWGEWSHLSRKPLQGHAVTALDSRARPRLSHEGDRTAGQPLGDLWRLLPRAHTCH